MMRGAALAACLALLAGCGSSDAWSPGWRYQPKGISLFFSRIKDGPSLGITCQRQIVFGVMHGDYGRDVAQFTVTSGDQRRTYKAFSGEHGRALLFPTEVPSSDGDRFADDLARGQGIVIRADDGRSMSVPGDPVVGEFIRACAEANKRR